MGAIPKGVIIKLTGTRHVCSFDGITGVQNQMSKMQRQFMGIVLFFSAEQITMFSWIKMTTHTIYVGFGLKASEHSIKRNRCSFGV